MGAIMKTWRQLSLTFEDTCEWLNELRKGVSSLDGFIDHHKHSLNASIHMLDMNHSALLAIRRQHVQIHLVIFWG